VRAIVGATLFALVFAPWTWMFPLCLIFLGIVGAWALLYRRAFSDGPRQPTLVLTVLTTLRSGGFCAKFFALHEDGRRIGPWD
jgi:hypothetical protein